MLLLRRLYDLLPNKNYLNNNHLNDNHLNNNHHNDEKTCYAIYETIK